VNSWSLNKEQGMCLKAGMKTPFAFHQLTNLLSIQISTLAEIHHLVPSDAHLPRTYCRNLMIWIFFFSKCGHFGPFWKNLCIGWNHTNHQ
jgi:hypothetical protein